jgi:serine/threonine protein kinase
MTLIGQLALSAGLIDEGALDWCLHLQRKFSESGKPMPLGEIFILRGHLDRTMLDRLLELQNDARGGPNISEPTEVMTLSSDAGDDVTMIDPNIAAAHVRDIAHGVRDSESSRRAVAETPVNPRTPLPLSGAGMRIGPYVVEKELSRGGMGTVFLARKEGDARWLALKLLNPLGGTSDELVVRFRREANFMLSLHHPNIVEAFEVGVVDSKHYLTMEYVEGETLEDRIKREKVLDPVEALRIMRQTTLGLQYAEELSLVHRDIKPANVLIRQDGVVKLADLGLAILAGREDLRLTAPGSLVGTPSYMSPEAIEAVRDLDTRTDIYAMGCTFYCAVCGRPPFRGQIVQICQGQKYSAPPRPIELRPDLLPAFERLLLICLEKDRNARYQTTAKLLEGIDFVMDVYEGRRGPAEIPPPAGSLGPQGGASGGANQADDLFGFGLAK